MNSFLNIHAVCNESDQTYSSNLMYCLADHAGMPGLHQELVRRELQWASLFQGTTEEAALSVAPLIFELPTKNYDNNRSFLRWLTEHGTYTSSMLLLSSPSDLETLRCQLTRRLYARITDGMDVLLRYFDPRVFESLLSVLDVQQASAFLSPADCWWYPNRSGQLIRRQSAWGIDEFLSPLHLDAEQEFAMLDANEIDVVEGRLRSMFPDLAIRLNVEKREHFLRCQIAAARATGIESTNDTILYCGLAVLHGENFAKISPWREILENMRINKLKFSEEVLAVEEKI